MGAVVRDEAHSVNPELLQGQREKFSQVRGQIHLVEAHSIGFLSAAQQFPEEGRPGVFPMG